jgi:beta-fructofuranosidase
MSKEEVLFTRERADKYIADNKKFVNPRFKPRYHAAAPLGWANDPNGAIYFKGKYHLFYQFYPYAPLWGPMHWGHLTSKDLITYTDENVALAPDLSDEHGCFSGGAIVKNNELILMYTKHYEGDYKRECQNIARSKNGFTFKKDNRPFLTSKDLPLDAVITDFRDPMPVNLDGVYYVLVGSKTHDDIGQIVVYKSLDLKTFNYHFTIGPDRRFGVMGECPSFLRFKDKDVLIVSGINMPRIGNEFKKSNSSAAFIGKIDFINKQYQLNIVHEIDAGHDFYAPHVFTDKDENYVMHAWMNMWNKTYFTALNGDGWTGAFVLPRMVFFADKRLWQTPIKSVYAYFEKEMPLVNNMKISKWSHLSFATSGNDFEVIISVKHNDYIVFGQECGSFFFDSTNHINFPQTKIYSNVPRGKLKVEVFLDSSSIEIFLNDGYETMTNLIYFYEDEYKVTLKNEQELTNAYVRKFKGGKDV